MSNTIQANYGAKGIALSAERHKTKGLRASSFLDAAGQTEKKAAEMPSASRNSGAGEEFLPAKLMMELRSAGQVQTEGTAATGSTSLETMLKTKYPNLVYHVFDASSSYWKTRNDYPHYLLYQSGDAAKETLENWEPSGENPFYGSKDGKFIAPKEIHALGNVPPGSKAVVIHPEVQARMEREPEYAKEIYAKIDAWFAFDAARNEAVMPGSSVGLSQAVAIGADGNICNACASRSGGTFSKSGDEMVQAYRLRMAKRADFMRWLAQEHLEEKIDEDAIAAAEEAKFRLAEMMEGGRLAEIFGSHISGVPTETVLAMTHTRIWGGVML